MCFELAAAALSVAQAAVGFQAANEDYENKALAWQQNYTNSLAAGRNEQSQLQLRMIEEEESALERIRQGKIEGAVVRSEAEASAAAANLGGISVGNILLDVDRQIAARRQAEKTNFENKARQLQQENKATVTTIQNRINSVQRPTAPNAAGFILQGIGGALAAFR